MNRVFPVFFTILWISVCAGLLLFTSPVWLNFPSVQDEYPDDGGVLTGNILEIESVGDTVIKVSMVDILAEGDSPPPLEHTVAVVSPQSLEKSQENSSAVRVLAPSPASGEHQDGGKMDILASSGVSLSSTRHVTATVPIVDTSTPSSQQSSSLDNRSSHIRNLDERVRRIENLQMYNQATWKDIRKLAAIAGQRTGGGYSPVPEAQSSSGYHRVKKGDTLYSVARELDIDVSCLYTWNKELVPDPDDVRMGIRLLTAGETKNCPSMPSGTSGYAAKPPSFAPNKERLTTEKNQQHAATEAVKHTASVAGKVEDWVVVSASDKAATVLNPATGEKAYLKTGLRQGDLGMIYKIDPYSGSVETQSGTIRRKQSR